MVSIAVVIRPGPELRRRLRRQVNRLVAHVRPWPLRLVYSPHYALEAEGVPMDPIRGERILTALAAEGLIADDTLREPELASFEALRRIHDDVYLGSLDDPAAVARALGVEIHLAAVERAIAVQRRMVGGTILATAWAREGGHVVANLGGGLHHADRSRGGGFCLFNDVAVAIADARARGFAGEVLVIDLDLHDGDGTRAIFADDEAVFTFSIHNRDWRPPDGVATRSIALGSGVTDAVYLAAIREHVPALLRDRRPALVYYLAGTDPAAGDRLGDWQISEDGLFARDRLVIEAVMNLSPRPAFVITLAGGYGPEAWRSSARALAWLQSGHDRSVAPPTAALTLMRYRHLARRFAPGELTGEGDALWGLSADDLLPPQERRVAPRFLDYYTKAGLELALERYGLFGRLRGKGFAAPAIAVDAPPGQAQAHTLTIFNASPAGEGGGDRRELLVELRVRRDRATVIGAELLAVDWLLLQDPRAAFTTQRPRLPGQEHPGLGLFSEVVGLLLMACERLGLDGLSVVPSQYHLAVHWSRHLRFVDPAARARFRALEGALAGLSLEAASRALAAGEVWDEGEGAPVRYEPAAMILPLSPGLRRRLDDEEAAYEAEAARVAATIRYRRRPPAEGSEG